MRLVKFIGMKLEIGANRAMVWNSVWRLAWDDAPDRETQRTRTAEWTGAIGDPLRTGGTGGAEYAALAQIPVSGLKFAPAEEDDFGYDVTFTAEIPAESDGDPETPVEDAATVCADRRQLDGDRIVRCTYKLATTGLTGFLPAIGDSLWWGGESLICADLEVVTDNGRSTVTVSARRLGTRMLGAVAVEITSAGTVKRAVYQVNRADYDAWSVANAPGSDASAWAGDDFIVTDFVGACVDLAVYKVTLTARIPEAAPVEPDPEPAADPEPTVRYQRKRATDFEATVVRRVEPGALAALLAANVPGGAAAWAGGAYYLAEISTGEAVDGKIPVTLRAVLGDWAMPDAAGVSGDERISRHVEEVAADAADAAAAQYVSGAPAPWLAEDSGFYVTGVETARISTELTRLTVTATEFLLGDVGIVERSVNDAGDETAKRTCRTLAAGYVPVSPGEAATAWAGAGFTVRAVSGTLRNRWVIETRLTAQKSAAAPATFGPLADADESDGETAWSMEYRFDDAAAAATFATAHPVGSAAPWSGTLTVVTVRAAGRLREKARVTLTARSLATRALGEPEILRDEYGNVTAVRHYRVPQTLLSAFLGAYTVGDAAAWGGANQYLSQIRSVRAGALEHTVTLTATELVYGPKRAWREESYGGLNAAGTTRRVLRYHQLNVVRPSELSAYNGRTGAAADWDGEDAVVTEVRVNRLNEFALEVELVAEERNNPGFFAYHEEEDRGDLATRVEYATHLGEFWLSAAQCGYYRNAHGQWTEIEDWTGSAECPFQTEEPLPRNLIDSTLKVLEIRKTAYLSGTVSANLELLRTWSQTRVAADTVGGISGVFRRVGVRTAEFRGNTGETWTGVEYRYALAPGSLVWNAAYWANH